MHIYTPEGMLVAQREKRLAEYHELVRHNIQRMMDCMYMGVDFLVKCTERDHDEFIAVANKQMHELGMIQAGWEMVFEIQDKGTGYISGVYVLIRPKRGF